MGLGSLGAAILSVKILVDASDAASGMGDAATGVEKFQGKLKGLIGPAALVGGAIVGMGKSAVDAASDSQQAMGGLETVFGKSADQMKAWGAGAAKSAGLSSTEYATAAAKIGSQLKTAGVPMDQIASKTDEMIRSGADLAATYGGTTADAVDALSSAMRGEADPAERYGLALSATAVSAKMAADGTSKLTGKAYTAAKATATMALIAEQGGDSLGQFAAQSGTAAEQQQIASASMANMAATLGQVLLPAVSLVSGMLAAMAGWIQQNSTLTLVIVGIIATFAGGILALAAALKVYQMWQTATAAATKGWAVAQGILNAVMSANPIALVIIGIVALVAVIVVLWNKSDAFRNFFIGVWKAISAAAAAAWQFIQSAAQAAMGVVSAVWRAIQSAASAVWSAISAIVRAAMSVVTAVVRAISGPIAAVWSAISAAARVAWSAVTAAVQYVTDRVKQIVNAIAAPIGSVWKAIADAARVAWDLVTAAVKVVIADVTAAWEAIVGVVKGIWDRVASAISTALGPVKSLIDDIKRIWDDTVGAISTGIGKIGGWLGGLLGKAKSIGSSVVGAVTPGGRSAAPSSNYAVAAAPTSAGLSARAMTTPIGSGSLLAGPQIIIQGAVDPDGTARQIRGILTGRDRRTAGVRIGGTATA